MDGRPRLILAGITLDASDARELAAFYHRLLGWTGITDEPERIVLGAPNGGPSLSFQTEKAYVRPVWAARAGLQQMSVHLDIQVDDLDAAGDHARRAGA